LRGCCHGLGACAGPPVWRPRCLWRLSFAHCSPSQPMPCAGKR
jgi:hypothetical protein